jgi:hypothetical protein
MAKHRDRSQPTMADLTPVNIPEGPERDAFLLRLVKSSSTAEARELVAMVEEFHHPITDTERLDWVLDNPGAAYGTHWAAEAMQHSITWYKGGKHPYWLVTGNTIRDCIDVILRGGGKPKY